MSDHVNNLADAHAADTVVKTATTYVKDLVERVLATFLVTAAGIAVTAGPADMLDATFWEGVAASAIAAVASLLKGMVARAFGVKNSASLVKDA